ncbi:competence/damage-inducible protein A, partial [Candidatus Poribacteria bacterium]
EVTVRITARGASEEEADRLIKGVEEEIRSRLGDNIYGIDPQTLEEVTGGLLLERGEAVAVAETTTGGAIVNRMASVDGSERFLVGGIVLASRRSVEMALGPVGRVVSSDVAERLASWAKSISGATYGLSATALLEPMEGFSESDVGLSYIALAKPDGTICREIRVIGDKPTMKQRISQAAIDLLRREIWRR